MCLFNPGANDAASYTGFLIFLTSRPLVLCFCSLIRLPLQVGVPAVGAGVREQKHKLRDKNKENVGSLCKEASGWLTDASGFWQGGRSANVLCGGGECLAWV